MGLNSRLSAINGKKWRFLRKLLLFLPKLSLFLRKLFGVFWHVFLAKNGLFRGCFSYKNTFTGRNGKKREVMGYKREEMGYKWEVIPYKREVIGYFFPFICFFREEIRHLWVYFRWNRYLGQKWRDKMKHPRCMMGGGAESRQSRKVLINQTKWTWLNSAAKEWSAWSIFSIVRWEGLRCPVM